MNSFLEMEPPVIYELLQDECHQTYQYIAAKKKQCTTPKLFANYSDAAECNNQHDLMFDQTKIILQRINHWVDYIQIQLKLGHPVTLHDLLGKYIEIHEELQLYSAEYHTTRYALLETLHLFYQNVLTVPIATKLLIAGLQTLTLTQQKVAPILAKALAITSDISLSYTAVQSLVVKQPKFHKATQTMITAVPDTVMPMSLLQ